MDGYPRDIRKLIRRLTDMLDVMDHISNNIEHIAFHLTDECYERE